MHRPRFFFRLMVGAMVAVWCAASAPAVFAGPSIKNARDEIADMRTKLSDAIEQLTGLQVLLIDLNDVLANAEADIAAMQSESAKNYIDDAIVVKDEQIPIVLDLLIGPDGILLDFEEEKQTLKGIVLALINNKKIKTVSGNRVLRNLNAINSLVQGTFNELDEVNALLEDDDAGEDTDPDIGCDDSLSPSPPDDPEDDCDDINDWLAAAIFHIDNGDDGPGSPAEDAILQAQRLCDQAQLIVDRILFKKLSIIIKRLDEADNVLKIEQYKKIAGRRDEVSIVLGKTPIVFSAERSLRLQIFDIHGRLVFERTGDAARALNGLGSYGDRLADGVYLYVLTQDGAASKIGKLVFQHGEK